MKNLALFLTTAILMFSCTQENIDNQIQNGLQGKIKTIYTSEDSTTYLFSYDSITTELTKVSISTKFDGRDTMLDVFSLNMLNDTLLDVQLGNSKYKVTCYNHQISIIEEVNAAGDHLSNCKIFTNNNNKVDSIFDDGFSVPILSNTFIHNFEYLNDNCTHYEKFWRDKLTGFPVGTVWQYSINYTTTENLHNFPIQDFYYNGTMFGQFITFLDVAGYHYIQPNKNLIENYEAHNVGNGSHLTTHFDYILSNDYVTKLTLTMPDGAINYRDITYY